MNRTKTKDEILEELSRSIAVQMKEVWEAGRSVGYQEGWSAYLEGNPNRKLTEE